MREPPEICEKNGNVVDNPIFATGSKLDHNVVFGAEGKFVLNPAAPETFENLETQSFEYIETDVPVGCYKILVILNDATDATESQSLSWQEDAFYVEPGRETYAEINLPKLSTTEVSTE